MRIILLCGVLTLLIPSLKVIEKVAPFAQHLQRQCANLFPVSFQNRKLAQSFVCGTPLKDPTSKRIFQSTGLLHLMVVSGSHLQLLAFFISIPVPKKWRKNRMAQFFSGIILSFYCLITGFQAPIVRALCARLFQNLSQTFRWGWDGNKVMMAGGLLVLMFVPEWISSFSFFLSWLASTGFLFSALSFESRPTIFTRFLRWMLACFCVQALTCIVFSQFSWIGLLCNFLLSPLIAFLLLPLSVSALLWPATAPIADYGWEWIVWLLTKVSNEWGSPTSPLMASSTLRWLGLWLFLAFVHSFFHGLKLTHFRSSNV